MNTTQRIVLVGLAVLSSAVMLAMCMVGGIFIARRGAAEALPPPPPEPAQPSPAPEAAPAPNNAPRIGLTFVGGCSPTFEHGVSVSFPRNGVVVASTAPITGELLGTLSVRLPDDSLPAPDRPVLLPALRRSPEGLGITVTDTHARSWGNATNHRRGVERVSGELLVQEYHRDSGRVRLELRDVVLENDRAESCRVEGTLETFGHYNEHARRAN